MDTRNLWRTSYSPTNFLLIPNCDYPVICTLVNGQVPPLWVTFFLLHRGSQVHWCSRRVYISWPVPPNKPVLLMLLTMSFVSPLLLSAKAMLWLRVCWPKLWCHTGWKLENRIYYWKFFNCVRELVIHVLSCGSQAGQCNPQSAQMLLPATDRASIIPLLSSALKWKKNLHCGLGPVSALAPPIPHAFASDFPFARVFDFELLFYKSMALPTLLDVMLPNSHVELLGFVSVLDLL